MANMSETTWTCLKQYTAIVFQHSNYFYWLNIFIIIISDNVKYETNTYKTNTVKINQMFKAYQHDKIMFIAKIYARIRAVW